MTKAVLGVIGGSGVYDLPGLENVREERIASPWGEPSGAVRIGTIAFDIGVAESFDSQVAACSPAAT